MAHKEELISEDGLRIDGRRANELRRIICKMGVIPTADGSAFFQQGHTQALATVFGPREVMRKGNLQQDKAIVNCEYTMTSFSSSERKKKIKGDRRALEISLIIKQTFESVILLHLAPRSQIDINIHILQADGGTRCAAINAVSLALVDAGVPLKELVVACAAGFINKTPILDLNYVEDSSGGVDMPVAYLPKSGKVTMLQMDSKIELESFETVFRLAVEGCKYINEILQKYIKEYTQQYINTRGVFAT